MGHSSKSGITAANPSKEKSSEAEEKSITPEMAEKTTDLTNLEKNQQMIKSTVSPHITKTFPKAVSSSSTMPVDPKKGKIEAIKRPCPDDNEENQKPDKR